MPTRPSLWRTALENVGRGAVILTTNASKDDVITSVRDRSMHPIWVELADAENLSEVTYCIGTELLLDMGAHASRKSREVGLDSFRYGVAEALDLLANDRGHVMVLNNLDRFAASDAHGFRQWTSDLVDVYNMRLGWYSYPTNPGYHLFDEDGPAWIVVLVGAQRTLEWAEKILEEANDAIVRSPHYWVFAWRVPVPILWVMPGGSSDDSH